MANAEFEVQPFISGLAYALTGQAEVLFVVFWSVVIFRSSFIFEELLGLAIVFGGALFLLIGKSNDKDSHIFYVLLALATTIPGGLSYVLKEKVFKDYHAVVLQSAANADRSASRGDGCGRHDTTGVDKLDIFAVNATTAILGLLWVIPVLFIGVKASQPMHDPEGSWHFTLGALQCFAGYTSAGSCEWAWRTYLLYILANMSMQISIYALVQQANAVLTFTCLKAVPAVAALLFMLQWPLIGSAAAKWQDWMSLVTITVGIAVFKHGSMLRHAGAPDGPARGWCWPLRGAEATAATDCSTSLAPGCS